MDRGRVFSGDSVGNTSGLIDLLYMIVSLIISVSLSPVFLIVILLFTIVDYCSGGIEDFKQGLAAKPSPRSSHAFVVNKKHKDRWIWQLLAGLASWDGA